MELHSKKKILSFIIILSIFLPAAAFINTAATSAGKKVRFNVGKTKTLRAGKSCVLKVKNLPKSAKIIRYKWKSSKSSVASVSQKGKVKAKNAGTAQITCLLTYTVKRADRNIKKKAKLTCRVKVTPGTAEKSETINSVPDGEIPQDTGRTPQEIVPTPSPQETLRPDAKSYVKEMGIGINLGNTMEAYWADDGNKTAGAQRIGDNTPQDYETCWGAVVTTKGVIDGYRDAGFSTVRIPVYWGNMMADDGEFAINEQYINRVGEIAGYCLKDNMYTVINIHHYDEFLIKNYSKDEVLQITEKLWTRIAGYFKDYPGRLIFEGFNESLGTQREEDHYSEDELYDYVNEMNQTFVDAVRKTGGNNTDRMLIVSGLWTNIDKTTDERFRMPEDIADDRLMVSVHYIDNALYWSNQIGNQTWIDESRKQCELLKRAFTDKGIPVFVGECTSIYDKERIAGNAEYTDSSACLSVIMNMAVDYGFIPVLWDVNDNMYSRTGYCIKSESDGKVITEIAGRIK